MSFRRFGRTCIIVLGVAALIVPAAAQAGKPSTYAPSLTTSLQPFGATSTSSPSGTPYVISGCGYDASFGGVTVVVHAPGSVGWVWDMPDANGCISVSNASTQGAGTYQIDAWQTVGKKAAVVASTGFVL
jgi:hypothetical protein